MVHCERSIGETVKKEWCLEGSDAHKVLMSLETRRDERGLYIDSDSAKAACPRLLVAGNVDHDVLAALLVSAYKGLAQSVESLKKK